MGRDLVFAGRSLHRSPGFTAVVVASLGLGFAVATVTLAITNAYLLRSLPYPGAERLYHLRYAPPGPYEPRGMTAIDWTTLTDVVDASIIGTGVAYYIGEAESLRRVSGTRVSPGFMAGLGVRPALGQGFSEEDFKSGAPLVALVGHALWRDRFNSDPQIVGKEIRARSDNQADGSVLIRVIGVLPPGFWFGRTSEAQPELLVPLQVPARTYMVRLREGVPVARAEQRITEAARAVGSDFQTGWAGVRLESIHERYVAGLRPLLFGINAASGLVLALVCANVSVLVLLRALRRQKEMAIRVALGAGRRHLVRLLAAEAMLLCAGALALGFFVTVLTLRLLAPVVEARLGRPPPGGPSAIFLDVPVVAAMGLAGAVFALALAFIPLLTQRRRELGDALRRNGVGVTDGLTMRRLRASLIALEVAGALVLLTGGGLMIRSVLNLVQTDYGFDAARLARIRVVLPSTYRDLPALAQFYQKLTERLATAAPASTVSSSFPAFYPTNKRPVEGDANLGNDVLVGVLPVGPGYFSVYGTPVRQGREFTSADRVDAEAVAIVSESLARQLWPQGSAVGRRIRTIRESEPTAAKTEWRTVVGIVRDIRQTYDDDDLRDLYLPFLQVPTRFGNVQVRTDRPAAVALSRLGNIVTELEPLAQVAEPVLLTAEDRQFAQAQFMLALLGGFAGFATLLAVLGIYGVTAYVVHQREKEIAIRMAIGASKEQVVRMFMRQGGIVIALGLGIGLAGTSMAGSVLLSQIHGVQPFDPGTAVLACCLLAMVALLATWWPARRAARADLLALLKEE
jgi:putative ABC transport system permease protein